jgi:hypothetical protein
VKVDTLPLQLSGQRVREAFDLLGLPWDDVLEVVITPGQLTIKSARTDDQGRMHAAGVDLSTVTVTIGITLVD